MSNAFRPENAMYSLDLSSQTSALLESLESTSADAVAYDTAWIARLDHRDPELAANALAWLRNHQLPDGSWGAAMPLYHHDRVICTLAAINALKRNGEAADSPRIDAALAALNHSLVNLDHDMAGKTVAFETILPSLVAEAKTLGLKIEDPNGTVERMARLREAKLASAPSGLIDRHTTLGFSAEMVGEEGLHLLDVDNLQLQDGSVSGSPAATAFYAAYTRPNPAALRYLHSVVRHGGAPHVTSSDIFEPAWVLWNLTRGRYIDPEVKAFSKRLLDYFATVWHRERGIAHDSRYTVQDGDDTGLVFALFAQFRHAPDLAALWHYEDATHFRSFDLESHASVSTNVHILGALHQSGLDEDHPAVRKITDFLRQEQIEQQFWVDKWHTSPYYATAHAIIVCSGFVDDVIENSVEWLLANQNADGSWGYFGPTAEETAFCLQALMARHQHGFDIPRKLLARGVAWLAAHAAPPYPPLWIIKTLYCPTPIVQSAILGALQQYKCEFGDLPGGV